MEWIKVKDKPPIANMKNIIVAGPDGGVYKPQGIRVDDYGDCFARINGKEREIYAYFEFAEPPVCNRPKKQNNTSAPNRRKRGTLNWPLNMLAEIDLEAFRGLIYLNTPPINWEANWETAKKIITEREAAILELYFRDEMTLQEIAVIFRLTRERVRQVLNAAKRRLRIKGRVDILMGKNKETAQPIEERKMFGEAVSVRALNCLYRANVRTNRDLLQMSEENIRNLRGVGAVVAAEILAYKATIEQQMGEQ